MRPSTAAATIDSRSAGQRPTRAPRSVSVGSSRYSSQTESGRAVLHWTLVCCQLLLHEDLDSATRTIDVPHQTDISAASRRAMLSATSCFHTSTGLVVSSSNSKRSTISGLMSATFT
jgi:hypothetical protein